MKRTTLFLLIVATTVLVVLSACGRREVRRETTIIREQAPSPSTGRVMVSQPPPAPREETRSVAPSSAHTWVPGYWSWENGWIWNPGHWEVPPRHTTAWVPGQWRSTDRGWVWQPEYWQ
jgi:hypothetical protein